MAWPSDIPCAIIFEDSSVTYLARLINYDGEPIQVADVTSITCRVCAMSDPSTHTSAPAVVVADSVFSSLQTDSRWDVDNQGYNFRHALAASSFPSPDAVYRIEYTLTMVAGDPILAALEVKTRHWYSS